MTTHIQLCLLLFDRFCPPMNKLSLRPCYIGIWMHRIANHNACTEHTAIFNSIIHTIYIVKNNSSRCLHIAAAVHATNCHFVAVIMNKKCWNSVDNIFHTDKQHFSGFSISLAHWINGKCLSVCDHDSEWLQRILLTHITHKWPATIWYGIHCRRSWRHVTSV